MTQLKLVSVGFDNDTLRSAVQRFKAPQQTNNI